MKCLLGYSISFLILFVLAFTSSSFAGKTDVISIVEKTTETQIRRLLDPLLDKYCHDQCKLLNVNVSVDLATPDELSPGFDDINTKSVGDLSPSSARVKLLIDDKVGPISRGKLLDLIQQYLDTFDFPVKIETQTAHFPMPQGSEGKIAELREKISKQFLSTANDLLRQFCPQSCILADFDLKTEAVNSEEVQYSNPGEFIQDGDTAIKIKNISATLLMDQTLSPEDQTNILEMLKLKTNSFKHVDLTGKSLKFPHPTNTNTNTDGSVVLDGKSGVRGIASENKSSSNTSNSNLNSNTKTDSNTNSNLKSDSTNNNTTNNKDIKNSTESNNKLEKFERFEKIERVENGDAVQEELKKFKVFGLIFALSILILLIFLTVATLKSSQKTQTHPIFHNIPRAPPQEEILEPSEMKSPSARPGSSQSISIRYEIERLIEELTTIYAQQPKVAKQVFTRVLAEEGTETTAEYIHIFGEAIIIEMLHDPSLQMDLNELMEYYAKNTIELEDDHKLELLRKLHHRTVAGKLVVLGNRSSLLFDFLVEMDAIQILELVRTESTTVKAIILTQCDLQKRSKIYAQLDPDVRMKLLSELSRIDYLPRDYIFNVASALKRKRKENPKLNTEALPGSEVLVSLLERTGQDMQKAVIRSLELANPDSARTVKSKLVSIDTLHYLRDGQLLEVVLSLKHDELIQFLKGAPPEVKELILRKSPKDLSIELEEEIAQLSAISREGYQVIERKILNRIKIMSNESQINLIETNERMFANTSIETGFIETVPSGGDPNRARFRKAGS